MRCIIILLFPVVVFSQSLAELKSFEYFKADSVALHFPKKKYRNVTEIATALAKDLPTQQEKFRAIFRWITDNIEYNKSAQNVTETSKILKKNKAVCQGFSNILKEMCNAVAIPCEVITGFTKTEAAEINKPLKKTDHAWNCVQLYGQWCLVDVTWATSKLDVFTHKFMKEFDEHYYLTPPEDFILDHFPKEKKYQFLAKPVKSKTFISWPVYYPDYFHLKIEGISLKKGTFKWQDSKPLHIVVSSAKNLENAAVLLNSDKFIIPVPLKYNEVEKQYYIDYVFEKPLRTDFTLYLNGQCVSEYIIKVK